MFLVRAAAAEASPPLYVPEVQRGGIDRGQLLWGGAAARDLPCFFHGLTGARGVWPGGGAPFRRGVVLLWPFTSPPSVSTIGCGGEARPAAGRDPQLTHKADSKMAVGVSRRTNRIAVDAFRLLGITTG